MKAVKPKRTVGPKTQNAQGGKPFLKGLFYWAIPAGMTLGVLFLALNMMPNDWFSFLKPGFQPEIMAESAIVVIPPDPPASVSLKSNEKSESNHPVASPQNDPWVMATYQALAQKMQGPEIHQKLQKQLLTKSFHAATDVGKEGADSPEKEMAWSDYQFKWVLQPDKYTMKIQVVGKDEKMALTLANGLAQALVEEYQANATSIAEKLTENSQFSSAHQSPSGAWVEEIPQGSPEAKLIQSIETQMKNAKEKLSEVNHALDHHPLKPLLHDPQASESVLPTVLESLSHRLQQTQKAYVSDEHTFQQLLKRLGVSSSQFSEKEAVFVKEFSQDVLLNTLQDEWKQTQLKLNAIVGQAEQTHQDLALYPEIPKLKKYQALLQNNMKDRVSVLLKKSKVEPKRIFDLPSNETTAPENPSGEALFPLSKTAKKAWLPTDGGNLYVQLAETSVHLKGAENKIHAIQHQVKQLKSQQKLTQPQSSQNPSQTSKSYGALEREKRYLERQIDFMATLLASHRAPQGQIGAPEFPLAKIKYPARLETPQSATAWGMPMVALVCVFLLGVLVLQKEKIQWVGSPDYFQPNLLKYLPMEGLEEAILGSPVKNASVSLKERVASFLIPSSGERPLSLDPGEIEASAFYENPTRGASAVQKLLPPTVVKPEVSFLLTPESPSQDPNNALNSPKLAQNFLSLTTPLVETKHFLKALRQPQVKNAFQDLLSQINWPHCPKIMAVSGNPMLASGIALAMAQDKTQNPGGTVLVDLDFEFPQVGGIFGVESHQGVVQWLLEPDAFPQTDPFQVENTLKETALTVIPAGSLNPEQYSSQPLSSFYGEEAADEAEWGESSREVWGMLENELGCPVEANGLPPELFDKLSDLIAQVSQHATRVVVHLPGVSTPERLAQCLQFLPLQGLLIDLPSTAQAEDFKAAWGEALESETSLEAFQLPWLRWVQWVMA